MSGAAETKAVAVLRRLPWAELADLVEALHAAGSDEDAIVDAVAELLDQVTPLDALIPGGAGVLAEALDRDVFEAAVRLVIGVSRRDPAKRAERKAAREARRRNRGRGDPNADRS